MVDQAVQQLRGDVKHQRAVLVAGLGITLLCTACSGGESSDRVSEKAAKTGRLTIGVLPDQPGLAQRQGSRRYAGFETEVATYIAAKLGTPASGITFVPVSHATRTDAVTRRTADFVIAQYPINAGSAREVSLVGPYLTAHLGFLVRNGDKKLATAESLTGRKVCYSDVTSARTAVPGAIWIQGKDDSDCLVRLLTEKVDAFAGIDAELVGYGAQNAGRTRLVATLRDPINYGVAIGKTETTTIEKIKSILKEMVSDGSWAKALTRNLPGMMARPPKSP